ncbi:MAG: hypothetical protein F6K55_35625 [Moorea sp. SIO4A3]|nr:hypothetical protein [Moorena sp. SIO4A3]
MWETPTRALDQDNEIHKNFSLFLAFDSRFPIPYSRFPIPDSLFPIPF